MCYYTNVDIMKGRLFMKTIMNGFTLAEALITLAIIGVIASITLPTLNSNVQKQQVGPALAKAINTLENANKLALSENGVRLLSELEGETYLDKLNTVSWQERNVIKNKSDLKSFCNNKPISCSTTKDGISFCVHEVGINGNYKDAPLPYHGTGVGVYIDINGDKGPDIVTKDIFFVIVDNKGFVIPYGGREYHTYAPKARDYVLWEHDGGCDDSKAKPKTRRSCTGSIVDNGYKVIYSW